MRRRSHLPGPAALMLVVISGLLSSCYLPIRWDAEITVSRFGTYEMIFDGYLAYIPLYDGLRKKEITPTEEREKVEIIRRDITRDSATKEFSYMGKGLFKMNWKQSGDLTRTGMVTFIRRNQAFFNIKYIKTTGLVTLEGIGVGKINAQRIAEMGLGTEGQLRIKTDAQVIESNAQRRGTDANQFYIWDIKSTQDAVPKLVLTLR